MSQANELDRAADSRNLPAVPVAGQIEPEVLDGQVVDDQPGAEPPPALRVVHIVRVVIQHEHTRAAGRHLGYIPAGIAVVFRRAWDSRSTARYERYLRAAEQTGNHEAALDWEERLAEFRRDRHQRRMDFLEYPLKVLLVLPKVLVSILMLYAVLGALLAIAAGHVGEAAVPVKVTADVVLWAGVAISVTWGPVLLALPWLVAAVLWHVGRTAGTGPAWARTSADPDADVTIDERLLAQALEAMRIPQIRDYLKQGLPLQFITPCRQEGRGTYAQIRLPKVPAEKIVRRRADFAAGLYRLPKEVWPSTGSEAAILDVWIADKGALAEGAGPYPLLDEGFTDVFKGLPFGRTLRGDPVRIPVIGRNTICGGMPEQGKSSAARVVTAGYTLDITTEVRIFVPDTNFDFEVFRPRCARYIMGAEDEHIEAILGELEDLKDELQARGQLLVDYEMPEVTAELARAGVGLHPLFVLLEEAHVAIQHHKHGKDIGLLLCDIVKLDRKRGAHVKVSTQAPTKDSMPRDVTRNCTNGIAFAVGDHVANDALLGQGAYAGGHRATELIPGTDRGTALVKGFTGQRSEIVQVHFLSVARGNDQVTPLVERSLAELARLGRAVPGTERTRRAEARDLLDDLDQVVGDERVKLADLPALLRDLAPAWKPYRALTGVQIAGRLDGAGVRTTLTGNVPRLDPADLRRALADRRGELGGLASELVFSPAPTRRLTGRWPAEVSRVRSDGGVRCPCCGPSGDGFSAVEHDLTHFGRNGMGLVKRQARRLFRQKVRKPAKAALNRLAERWCADCQKNVQPFHLCAPKTDFKGRRAQQERTERRRHKGATRPPRQRREHDYRTCRDQDCPRDLCRAFREGQQACPLPHQ